MADSDDVDEQFRRLVADLDSPEQAALPKPSRASMREVKREAKARKKAAAAPPRPVEPHRAYLAGPPAKAPRARSERARTILVGVIVLAVMSGLIWFQWFRGPGTDPGPSAATPTATAPSSSAATPSTVPAGSDHPTPGREAAAAPLGKPPTVADAPGKYAFISKQKGSSAPVAYDPCRPIHYVVNRTHQPAQGARLVTDAVAALSAATGLRFVADGTTKEPASFDRDAYQPDRYGDRWAPLLIAWPTGAEQPDFVGNNIGEAGSQYVYVNGGPRVYVTGVALFDSDWFARTLTEPRGYARAESVLLHELGHVVGLGHVTDQSQIMFAMETPSVTRYAAGDLAGLAKLGAGACEPRL